MSIDSALNYILFSNPISSATSSYILKSSQSLISAIQGLMPKPQPQIVMMDPDPLWKLAKNGGWFVRIAGMSGAIAVILGAYGAHKLLPRKDIDESRKQVFETANKYHYYHTLALLGAPLCRYPILTGSVMMVGMTLFSASSYYLAFTGDGQFRKVTPIGGTCLILGWLTMIL